MDVSAIRSHPFTGAHMSFDPLLPEQAERAEQISQQPCGDDREVFATAKSRDWHEDAESKTCAKIAIDVTGVPQQGLEARVAEGKMAAVAMVYDSIPEPRD